MSSRTSLHRNKALVKAVRQAGGQAALARSLEERGFPVRQPSICGWLVTGKPTPAACPLIEEITGVRCEELLPAVFQRFVEVQARRAA